MGKFIRQIWVNYNTSDINNQCPVPSHWAVPEIICLDVPKRFSGFKSPYLVSVMEKYSLNLSWNLFFV